MNPEFDVLIDRYFVTIPRAERTEVLGEIIRHIAENLNEMGLIHVARPVLIANRVSGAATITSPQATEGWSSAQWDVR
jgi:hypothetical protein